MKFKRITARTKMTFPCVLAQPRKGIDSWLTYVADGHDHVNEDWARCHYTHWLPFQWPKGSSWKK